MPSRADGNAAALLSALRRLDATLARALEAVQLAGWAPPGDDAFRGLYISDTDAIHLLARQPIAAPFRIPLDDVSPLVDLPPFAQLAHAFELEPFDLEVITIAAAAELDLRYERLYGYLQDDVTKRRPTVDLALTLLCSDARERLTRRRRFTPDAPLVRHGLIHLDGDESTSLLAHALIADEALVRFLTGDRRLDPRLAGVGRLVDRPVAASPLDERTRTFISKAVSERHPHVVFGGPPDSGQREAAAAFAAELRRPLLMLVPENEVPDGTLAVGAREARLRGAVLYVEGVPAPTPAPPVVVEAIATDAPARGAPSLEFKPLALQQRRLTWRHELRAHNVRCTSRVLEDVATRFALGPGRIAAAAEQATAALRSSNGEGAREVIFRAARSQSASELGTLAVRLVPRHTWDELILPAGSIDQLRELCLRVSRRERVMHEWGFDAKLSTGKGASALFAGGSGTGKTMAAEVVAHDLGLDVFRINLAGVVSKYIGETEKNLDRIFAAAEGSNAILFFDEADALFGKRSEVRDSHDRYANIEISYLLQKMDAYEGVAILATNLRESLDDAFLRRLSAIVNFPFPDEAARARIWRVVWPPEAAIDTDFDPDELAIRFKLSGGAIKNVALAAAFLAAADGASIGRRHIVAAVRAEFRKLGKSLTDDDVGAVEALEAA